MKTKKQLSIRIYPDTFQRLQYIAQSETRTANGQIVHLINKCIGAFEKENGEIELTGDSK